MVILSTCITHFCDVMLVTESGYLNCVFSPWSSEGTSLLVLCGPSVWRQLYSLQRQLDDRRTDINDLKQERQSLLGLVRSLNSDIQDLKRQISGHEKTSQDKVAESSSAPDTMSYHFIESINMSPLHMQDNTISNLKKKNQNLEKLRFVLDCQLDDLRQQVEPQQEDISKKKDHIQQVCVIMGFQQQAAEYSHPHRCGVSAVPQLEEELLLLDRSNTQLQLTVSDLRLKLRAKEAEIRKEMQKVSTHTIPAAVYRCHPRGAFPSMKPGLRSLLVDLHPTVNGGSILCPGERLRNASSAASLRPSYLC